MTHFAREYGSALFELAMEENLAEEISEEMTFLVSSFHEQPEYIRLLCTRSIEVETRRQLLDEAFRGRLNPYVLNFLKLLTERGRMQFFFDCAQCYRTLYNEAFGIVEASVTSAVELDSRQREALVRKLQEMSGKKIVLHEKTDPSLIGGIRVDMEGRRYDNSIRERLEVLRRSLTES